MINCFIKRVARPCTLAFSSLQQEIKQVITPYGNATPKILSFIGRDLYKKPNHPLGILKNKIEILMPEFKVFDSFNPVVTVQENFDDLLTPANHVSRKRSDTYYLNETQLLRTHTSAYQKRLIESRQDPFLVFADVYRRDEIDSTHNPVFHQMEAVKIFPMGTNPDVVLNDLKLTCETLINNLFGQSIRRRWVDAYFPFTDPSLEVEIEWEGRWLEMLGCGVVHSELMRNTKRDEIGWALGLGLERFAMLLFDIPDIRLFWSEDPRFLGQFKAGSISKFQPYSRYPSCYKDISLFVDQTFEENDFHEVVREHGGHLVEKVECVDTFQKGERISKCYRIHYRSLDRTLLNQEIDDIQFRIRKELGSKWQLR